MLGVGREWCVVVVIYFDGFFEGGDGFFWSCYYMSGGVGLGWGGNGGGDGREMGYCCLECVLGFNLVVEGVFYVVVFVVGWVFGFVYGVLVCLVGGVGDVVVG